MSEDKPKKEVKEKKEKKEKKPKLLKISDLCFAAAEAERLIPGGKEQLVDEIMTTFKEAGQTHNIKGKPITKERVSSQVSAWLGDVRNERQGKWAKYKAPEGDDGIQFSKRA